MDKLLYLIVGKNQTDIIFHDSFLGSNQDLTKEFVPDDDPKVIQWLNRYQELSQGSQPIDKIYLFVLNPIENRMVLVHVLEYGNKQEND